MHAYGDEIEAFDTPEKRTVFKHPPPPWFR
jgi:hypothetical protein